MLSRTLQTEQLDLLIISSLVNATLHTLDDSLLLSANWVLELLDDHEQLEEATGIIVTLADTTTFQEQVTEPFIAHLKENITSRFSSLDDVISAMSIIDPRKAPKADSQTPVWGRSNWYTPSALRVRKTSRDPAWKFNKQESHNNL